MISINTCCVNKQARPNHDHTRSGLFVDTNILSNLLGLDKQNNSKIEQKYNKALLFNYLAQNNILLGIFNFYEIVKKVNDEHTLRKITQFDFVIMSNLNINLNTLNTNVKTNILNQQERHDFISEMNKVLCDYASEHYSNVLIFPFVVLVYSLTKNFSDFSYVNKRINKVKNVIRSNLENTLLAKNISIKSNFEKAIRLYYHIISSSTLDAINTNSHEKASPSELELFNLFCDTFNNRLSFLIEKYTKINSVTSKSLKSSDNIIRKIFEYFEHERSRVMNDNSKNNFLEIFKEYMIKAANSLFSSTRKDEVMDNYFKEHVQKFYINQLTCDNEKKIYFSTNDFIDMLSLSMAVNKDVPYLTTDLKMYLYAGNDYIAKHKDTLSKFIYNSW